MFRINEAYDNRAVLTVKDGQMTVHITLQSQKIINLYPGLADDAAKEDDSAVMYFFIRGAHSSRGCPLT